MVTNDFRTFFPKRDGKKTFWVYPLLKRPVITVASAVTPVPYKKIGLIGTEATVRSHYYQKRFPITSAVACPKLVASIEQGDLDLSELEYLSKDIEALLLGCTHFPLIQEHLPPIPLIDPSRALAESLPKTTGSSTFYTTGDPLQFHQRATIFSKRKKNPFSFSSEVSILLFIIVIFSRLYESKETYFADRR